MRVCRRDIKNELSRDSVKLALDELHSGLLFCEPDGNILLVNGRMQRLMQVLCGEVYRDGKKFYERLLSGDVSDSCSSNVIDGKTVFILPDGKVWFFTRCDIYIKNRRHVQLSAADVTEQWMLTNELNAQRAMLQSRGLELKEMISEVRFLCREEEMLRIRSRFHDILGQRLALLFRRLKQEGLVTGESFRGLCPLPGLTRLERDCFIECFSSLGRMEAEQECQQLAFYQERFTLFLQQAQEHARPQLELSHKLGFAAGLAAAILCL